MIKGVSWLPSGAPVFFFGLSHKNLNLLRQGKPISIDLKELGGEGHIVIGGGETW